MLTEFFSKILFYLYNLFGGNLGLAIIALTSFLKILLFPITLSSLKSAEKMKRIQPELNNLKKKHKDPKKLQQAQADIFKKHKVNPLGSFIPQIVQIVVFIMLYRLLMGFLNTGVVGDEVINTQFLWLDLTKPDQYFILPVLAAVSQFALSYLMQLKKPKTKSNQTSVKDGDKEGMMAGMGKTMIYVMPLITGFFAMRFPSGLVIYWVTSNLFSLVQQIYFLKTFKHEELDNNSVDKHKKKVKLPATIIEAEVVDSETKNKFKTALKKTKTKSKPKKKSKNLKNKPKKKKSKK